MNKIIKHLKKIERQSYPQHMRQMQDCRSMSDLAEYCECSVEELSIITWDEAYALFANFPSYVEVVDLAGNMVGHLKELLESLRGFGKPVYMDARESTSYKLVQYLARHGSIEIEQDEPWDWDGEVMRSITLSFK